MDALSKIIARAKGLNRHIVLPEGSDPRIIAGVIQAARENIARITILGNETKIRPLIRQAGDHEDKVAIIDPQGEDPLSIANQMVVQGQADGTVAGAVSNSTDVLRAAIRTIGLDPAHKMVSSLFLMGLSEYENEQPRTVIFTDCAMVVDPNARKLARIAGAASAAARLFLEETPKLAFLSFATHDSATDAVIEKVKRAYDFFAERHPDVMADGPLQFDAAFLPDIRATKAPDSPLTGSANIFVFPDLNSGNIGYKIAERLGNAKAIGPILMGLNKPANDLSRGCSADDVYNMIAVTAVQSQLPDGL